MIPIPAEHELPAKSHRNERNKKKRSFFLNDKLAWRSKGIAPIITKRRKNRAFSTPHFSLKNEGASHSGGGRKRTEIGAAHGGGRASGGGGGTGRRAASADLASESGAGARSAARGGEAPLPLGARFGSHCRLGGERGRGGEGGRREEEERERERESSGARRLVSCGLANWGWWKRGCLHVHQTAGPTRQEVLQVSHLGP